VRITFVVPMLEVSGGARIIAGHARRLADRGHEVRIVAPRPPRPSLKQRARALLAGEPLPDPRKDALVALSGVPLYWPRHGGPVAEADVPDADVIIATWWATAEWIWPMSPAKGAKVHFLQHYEAFPNVPTARVEAVWRLPTSKIAIAQWLIDLGRKRFGIRDMALIPNSIDHHLFDGSLRGKSERPTVGFLFHHAGFKDLPTSLAAIRRLTELRPDIQVISFGAVQPLAGELPPNVEFHLLPAQEQIASIYRRCDAWLSTSITEGFNLPPLEAMGSGCPAVCSKTGRPLEIIENGVNGYLVDQGDAEGFALAVDSILSLSDEAWRRMSDAARESVAHPTWEESSALFERALIRSVQISRR